MNQLHSTPDFQLIPTSLLENNQPVRLELGICKPQGPGPYPVIIFNHGSTGSGRNPNLFRQTVHQPAVSRFFTERGWMVAYPQRRGRGKSGGLYQEGLGKPGRGYSCKPELSLAGVDRAIEDLDAVMEYITTRTDVLQNKILIAGTSRGGALSIAYAGHHPGQFVGAINVSGGWLGRGCKATYAAINQSVFLQGATFPGATLWLHGTTDSYYSIGHCKANFDAYRAEGGQGSFHTLNAGHNLISRHDLWESPLIKYLAALDNDLTAPRSS